VEARGRSFGTIATTWKDAFRGKSDGRASTNTTPACSAPACGGARYRADDADDAGFESFANRSLQTAERETAVRFDEFAWRIRPLERAK
jgi:hypothetical protein